jgi:phenylalanyl-tRNA synthetase alpha chain
MTTNITELINEKRLAKFHNNPNHPICQMKELIQSHFTGFSFFDTLNEAVTTKANFDDLLIPKDHPARSMNDTYYVDENTVLRTHTSAHQNDLMNAGETKFLVAGDVYRKDTIDKSHYPVFHQIEGVKIVADSEDPLEDLKNTLIGLVNFLFPGKEYRFLDDYFPFTNPSLQIEVKVTDDYWMEILGCGVIEPKILENCGIKGHGWAFGLGLDRLLLYKANIPDIRYLWTSDQRFIKQFSKGLTEFKEYSKFPITVRDISFWITGTPLKNKEHWEEHNNFCEVCREVGNDLIESISQVDRFEKDNRVSFAYKIVYRSNNRTLLGDEINDMQTILRSKVVEKFRVTLR